ncbi:MAG: hypothetical protein ACI4NA_07520, partial [Succinivibrio sp.]
EERLMLEYKRSRHPDLYRSSAGRSGRGLTRGYFQGVEDGRGGFELLRGVEGAARAELGFKD